MRRTDPASHDPATRRLRARGLSLAALALLASTASPALACTLCYSRQAATLRERLSGADMLWNLCALALPLLLLTAIVALIAREPVAGS